MKQYILLIAILISSVSFSQDSTAIEKVETPIILSKVYLGKSVVHDNFEIKFIDVLEDSRCPKGVNCIWAGEVIVLVDLYKNGKKVERKKITLNPKVEFQNKIGNLFLSEAFSMSVLNVLPHPRANNKTKPNEYYLLLDVKF